MKAGVLALQGDVREHAAMLAACGAEPVNVRTVEELSGVGCLVIPGGESTTISTLARSAGLVEPIVHRVREGMPVFGTCAGMILLARRVLDGEPLFGLMDITVRRNAYGRQVDSFEAELSVQGVGGPLRVAFIRAPWVEEVGPGVRVLAEHEGRPVALEENNLLVASFHPEILGEARLHEYFLKSVSTS